MTQRTTGSGNWSAKVTRESFALELEEGVFTWDDPRRIAQSLKRSAETSTHRKAPPFRSAMSMLVFYINRAGMNLNENQKRILEQAKDELRAIWQKLRRHSVVMRLMRRGSGRRNNGLDNLAY